MKIVILERNSIGLDVSTDVFREFGEVVEYPNTVGVEQAAERMKDADIVIANKVKMNRDSLKDAKNVKLICLFATGYDNIDLEYCKERGIRAANVTNYCCPAVAQHTLLLGMMLAEKIAYYDDYVKSGAYQAQDFHISTDHFMIWKEKHGALSVWATSENVWQEWPQAWDVR